MCSLFYPKQLHTSQANTIWWHPFKQLKLDQGVDKLPTTRIVWLEHIRRAHVQWSVWSHDLIVNSVVPDPVQLRYLVQYIKLLSLLTKETLAPGAVLQLIRCNCGSTIVESTSTTRRCSCKRHDLFCTELCNCAGYDVSRTQRMKMKEYLCLNITPGPVRDGGVLT